MTSVKEIVEQLPLIASYFVGGYVFLITYKFVAFKQEKAEPKYLIFKSVIANTIVKNLYDYIFKIEETNKLYVPILCLICAMLGVVCGKLIRWKKLHNLLFKIGIHRTPNENIWDDVIKDGQNCWVRLRSPKIDDLQYQGVFKYGEEFKSEPIVALGNYQVLNMNGDIITDYSDTDNILMLNTKNFEKIEIVYEKQGEILENENAPKIFGEVKEK